MPLLPSHLSHSKNDSSTRDYEQRVQLAPPPSICVTGVMSRDGQCPVERVLHDDDGSRRTCTIRYRIFRPRQVSMHPPPLVVLHGGPSVPSNYLFSLVNVVTDRAIIFYDQIGCGRSTRPTERECYSIEHCVDDLVQLLQHWNLQQFHLYGQSFGGIVAFEFLKRTRDTRCLSCIMSSVPSNIRLAKEESERLLTEIRASADTDNDREVQEIFRQQHECRTVPTPLSLMDAYAQAGTVWRGIDAIPDYVATLNDNGSEKLDYPLFLLRGQYDFVTQACIEPWSEFFTKSQSMVLAGCSHHGLLENEQLYGAVVSSFLQDNDPTQAETTVSAVTT